MRSPARLLLVLGLAAPGLCFAQYNYLSFKMLNTADKPFPYYIDNRSASPAGLDLVGVRTASERAWSAWNAVTCASPKVTSKGYSVGIVPDPANAYDAFSVTPVWLSSTSDPDFIQVFGAGASQVASLTLPLAYAGVLQNCDIFFNSANVQWSTNDTTPSSAQDVETLMLHEAGHCLGLDHYGGVGNIMNPALPLGQNQRSLGPGDPTALCDQNPISGVAGAPCGADGGCGTNPSLKCLPQPTTSGVDVKRCSKGCTLNTNGGCDAPLSCQASAVFAPGFNGACLEPGSLVTQVGKPCGANGECGSAIGLCNVPVASTTGNIFWANGYCTQHCNTGDAPCPAGSACLNLGGVNQCTQSCRVGLADCRPEYSCLDDGSGTTGTCIPRCYGNADCADPLTFFCHTCDGLCSSRNNISGQIGDGCTSEATCGQGQLCRAVSATSGVKTCTQQCARGCGVCPSGSTCTPLAAGDLFCLKDCTGPGTCPAGLRCADTTAGKGCIPACTQNTDCPVGENCFAGECYPPETDAGCTTLCNVTDAGHPIVPPVKDAGTGFGGNGGCGCNNSSGALPFFFLALLVLAVSRRSPWRAR